MVDKAIFEIDLSDAKFQQFASTFEQFKAESAKIKGAWKANDSLIAAATKNLNAMSAGKPAAQDHAESIAGAMASWAGAGWDNISGGSKAVTGNIRSATLHLGKWTGITTVFGSLIAAGGIWGVSRMATDASGKRASAARLGTTYSRQEAAGAAFVGIPDAGKIISGLSTATSSQEGMGPLFQLMGRDAEGLRGGDPVESFVKILPYLKKMADQGGSWGTMNERLKAMGLGKIGVSTETLRLLRALTPEDIKEMISAERAAEPHMRVSPKDLKALQDFQTALFEAGTTLTNLFGANLVNLTPVVARGTMLFTKIIEMMAREGGPLPAMLKKFDELFLASTATLLEGKEFTEGVLRFGEVVANIGRLIGSGDANELKVKLAALGGWMLAGPYGAAIGGGIAVGTMWDGPGTPVDEERTARGLSPRSGGSATTPGGPDRADNPSTTPLQHRPKFGGISAPWKTPEHGETSPHVSGTPTSSAVQQPSPGPFQPAGFTYPAIHELESATTGIPGGRRRISAENDEFHHKVAPNSLHTKGLAFDQSLNDPSRHAAAAAYMRLKLRAAGLSNDDFHVIDEYAHPSAHSTGGHVHTQFNTVAAAQKYEKYYRNHPQLQGRQSHIEVDDQTGEAGHVEIDSRHSGPMTPH